MRPRSKTLTGQELEIMKVVWEREQATVRDVYEVLLKRRKVAYTTVMTMMKILEQKGFLRKSQEERAYVYRPAQPKRQVIGFMVRDFINRVFNGSAEPLLVHLVEEHHLSPKDLEEIAHLRKKEGREAGRGASHDRGEKS
jgi:BlaI family transcriptional regulator, penicillinase repressor